MGLAYIDGKIKGTIAEVIVENMLQKLGFFVLKTAQESIVNPILQIERFVSKCNGNLKFIKDIENLQTLNTLRKLPDFIIVSPNGRVDFIEVKFRNKGMINERDMEVFHHFPDTQLMIVNLEVGDNIFYSENKEHKEEIKEEDKKKFQDSRFNICLLDELNNEDVNDEIIGIYTSAHFIILKEWLKNRYDIEDDAIINNFSELVVKWLSIKEEIDH